MKYLLFIAVITCYVTGCKKDGQVSTDITGTWELRNYSGTIAGVNKNYPKGNGSLMQFNADGSYASFVNFQPNIQGKYRIVKDAVQWAGQTYDGIYYNDNSNVDFMLLKADTLTIGNTFPDGVTQVYVRQK